jgi:D-alanine-D-alanine ligase
MSERQLTVGVIFGSRSVEHDVAVVSATQVMKALEGPQYQVIPIYITRDGRWYTGENLKQLRNFNIDDIANLAGTQETTLGSGTGFKGLITPPLSSRFGKNNLQALDVIFPVIHGSHGEDGTLQGLLEMVDLPYVGTGVLASAIANDKIMSKALLKAAGVPVIEQYVAFSTRQWAEGRAELLAQLEAIGFPLIVKPATLGSSIGVAVANDSAMLATHIDIALNMDRQVLVEKAICGPQVVEINCALLGGDGLVRASTLEQPNFTLDCGRLLGFDEKYPSKTGQGMKGQDRIIPAPISEDLTARIKETAITAFNAIQGHGTARIDFLLDGSTGQFWLNEINTLPGSLAFYLWEPEGMSASKVCDTLIQLALHRHQEKQRLTYNYKSRLIEVASQRGAKGLKSS